MKLPAIFEKEMQELLGDEYRSYMESFAQSYKKGIRINTGKISVEEFLRITPFELEAVPWVDNGFYYTDEAVTKHPHYFAGLYYVQEPSAMIPASRIPIEKGDRVLDLCAAPGGKATELGARLGGSGMLLANDISNSRAKALLKNLELFGIKNACVSSETPGKLVQSFEQFFDKIVIDAPCSGEGMFRKDASMIKDWEEKGPLAYVPIQKEILAAAYQMLKPGGNLLYSTCTFSKLEDEDNIGWFLENYPDMILEEPKWNPSFTHGRAGFEQCIRIFPHRAAGEGHFAALLKKRNEEELCTAKRAKKSDQADQMPKNKEFEQFIKEIPLPEGGQYHLQNDCVYLLPAGMERKKGIRYLRTGLFLGEISRGHFKPSQALAMSLGKEDYPRIISFSSEDERIVRYLKGETIDLSNTEWKDAKGWLLVCVDGYSLGWAKAANESLKNKYYAGWRMQ